MLYLVKYPYECAEQRASRVLAIAALRDVLAAFKTKDMPSPAALEASVKADIERLSQMQNYDGGFAFWERGRPVEAVPQRLRRERARARAGEGLRGAEGDARRARSRTSRTSSATTPGTTRKEVRWAISAYALYTRKQMGDLDIAKGQKLLAEYGGDEGCDGRMETHGWMLGLFAQNKTAEAERKEIVRHAMNTVSETAGAANFVTSYGDGATSCSSSDRRVDAVMLESLIQEQQELDLIPKVVTGLLAHRKAGRWLNTQENTFALLALDRYFQTYEKVTPDFVARVWLGDDYAGEHAFKGRTTDYFQINIPMEDVATHDKQDADDPEGRQGPALLPHRHDLRAGVAQARAGGLRLRRARARTRASTIRRTSRATRDGVWHIKAGARVRVKLTMVNENRRYHVALVDPLPAGLEAMNPALAVTGPIPTGPERAEGARRVLVVVRPLVRAPEPARRARRGVRVAAVGGRAQLRVRRARDDARQLRRAADQGRRDVHARDVRAQCQ